MTPSQERPRATKREGRTMRKKQGNKKGSAPAVAVRSFMRNRAGGVHDNGEKISTPGEKELWERVGGLRASLSIALY